MKQNKTIIFAFILIIVAGALYRIVPGRMPGFAPQIAMAIFGGAVIKDKKWGFAIPLFSMLLSDLLFEGLNRAGVTHNMAGFYPGQWLNYILLSGTAVFGMLMRRINIGNLAVAAVSAPIAFFLFSNFATWAMGGGWGHPKTFAGLMLTMSEGVPFLGTSLLATISFSALFFGTHYLVQRSQDRKMSKSFA